MVKRLTSMTYEELQTERDANELLKNNLKAQIEKVTDAKVCLKLSQELLQLSKRNKKLAARQGVLLRKIKRPIEMSLEEIEAEITQNKITIPQVEQQLTSSNFDTRFNANQELRTIYARHKALCSQRVALLSHSIALLKQELNNATQKR